MSGSFLDFFANLQERQHAGPVPPRAPAVGSSLQNENAPNAAAQAAAAAAPPSRPAPRQNGAHAAPASPRRQEARTFLVVDFFSLESHRPFIYLTQHNKCFHTLQQLIIIMMMIHLQFRGQRFKQLPPVLVHFSPPCAQIKISSPTTPTKPIRWST